jgi:hypothetical protein
MATLSANPRCLRSVTLERASRFSSRSGLFSELNLASQLYKKRTTEGIELAVHSVPDLKRIPFDEAVNQHFEPTKTGTSYGPSWVICFLFFSDMEWHHNDVTQPIHVFNDHHYRVLIGSKSRSRFQANGLANKLNYYGTRTVRP